MKSIAIRADASLEAGSGHVARMEALAAALRQRGADVTFVTASMPEDLAARVTGAGFALERVAETAAVLPRAFDLLVVDHYGLDAAWERRARERANRIAAVDDLGRPHDCDVLIDQNLGASLQTYRSRVPAAARLLLGPRYALLRAEFRPFALAPARERASLERILVSMGGYDAADAAGTALRGLAAAGTAAQVDLLLPRSAPHAEAAARLCANYGFHYVEPHANVSAVMERADLAIGATGGTAWERCMLGLPTLAITVAENQRAGADALASAGAALWLGDLGPETEMRVTHAVRALSANPAPLRAMSRAARAVMDADGDNGFSTDRVAAELWGDLHG